MRPAQSVPKFTPVYHLSEKLASPRALWKSTEGKAPGDMMWDFKFSKPGKRIESMVAEAGQCTVRHS